MAAPGVLKDLRWEAQRSLAFGSVVAGYTAMGTPIEHPIRQLKLINWTDALLQVSFDGIVDHFPIMPYTGEIYDVGSNEEDGSEYYVTTGTRVYVKRIDTPTLGAIYLSVNYARGS